MTDDLIQKIDSYLQSKGAPNANGNMDFFQSDETEEIVCRHDVSPLITKRYMNGSYWAKYNFSYYAKSQDKITALDNLKRIQDALFIDEFRNLLDLDEGRIEIISQCVPVSQDDSGTVVYSSGFKLTYFTEG